MQELEKILEEIDIKIAGSMGRKREGLLEARDIIRKHRNDDWIPVEERLPDPKEETRAFIVTERNGNVWGDIYYGYADVMDEEPCFHRLDDEMWCCFKPDVIAWRPLPEPYRPERSKE